LQLAAQLLHASCRPEGSKPHKPTANSRCHQEGEIVVSSTAAAPAAVETPETTAEEPKAKKVGWWQRRLGLG
jgi:hypothetical protein